MAQKLTLGYWKGYGKAQPARYLLELTETPYTEIQYVEDDDWFVRDKFNLGLPFPNLPYIIDGDVKLTEFTALFDYLADTYGKPEWVGNGQDKYTVRMLRGLFEDVASGLYHTTIEPEGKREKTLESEVLAKLRYVKTFLGAKEYLLGYFTVADIYFLSVLNFFKATQTEANFSEFAEAFNPILLKLRSIPQIAAYIASERHPV